MRRLALLATLLVVLSCVLPVVAFSQNTIDSGPPLVNYLRTNINDTAPGDRINCLPKDLAEWIPAALPKDSYQVGSGDVLTVNVKGKANLNYHVNDESKTDANPDEATVTPGGEIYLPLVGKISVAGKTVSGIESIVKARLGKYIKSFDVTVTVSKIRTVNVWIGGEVDNPGPRIMPTLSTATLAALQSSIKPTGSTRRITLVRGKDRKTVDLYKMSITGDVSGDIPLQPGDSVYIPPVTDYVEIDGEITRPGKYEMFAVTGGSGSFTVRDLVELSLGLTPSAAKDKAYIERIGDDGLKKLVNLDLRDMAKGKDANLALQPGDKLVIPTISIYQPIIRLIGEFKGEGVYQRATGMSTLEVQNKSGIYFLKQGQTVLDIISATGGVTPQADLTRGHIERTENGVQRIIPIDLERLMVKGDKTADIALQNGDSIVLPAVADKIHVFGEVKSPGSFVYSPNRRLVDYIGDAGGPTSLAKLTLVSVVRVTNGKPDVRKYNAQNAMRGNSAQDNPVLEPGDIVYITPKFVSDWRDAVQLVFTAFSLRALFR